MRVILKGGNQYKRKVVKEQKGAGVGEINGTSFALSD
jgi:hypothetical protein